MVGIPARHRQDQPGPGPAAPAVRAPDIPPERWAQFVGLARATRSAEELLHAALGHPVLAEPVEDYPGTAPAGDGQGPVWVLQHRLRHPHSSQVLAWCVSLVSWQHLPLLPRIAVRSGQATLTQVLHRGGEDWASDPVSTWQRRASDASWWQVDTRSGYDAPLLQVTRLVTMRATPVAVIHEEIIHPATGRGPPRRGHPTTSPHRAPSPRRRRTSAADITARDRTRFQGHLRPRAAHHP